MLMNRLFAQCRFSSHWYSIRSFILSKPYICLVLTTCAFMLVAAYARKQYFTGYLVHNEFSGLFGNSVFGTRFPLYLHYVRFKRENEEVELRFEDYLGVLSAVQRLQPDVIMLHGDQEPSGYYWGLLKSQNLVHFSRMAPLNETGWWANHPRPVDLTEHRADIAKLDALLEFGGVAADFDVYFIRGERLRPLLQAGRFVTCYGNKEGYNMGLLAGQKTSKILWAWRRAYTDIYNGGDWNFNSGFVPKFLSHLYPHEAYVLNNTCNNPHPSSIRPFFLEYGKFDWENSLAIHSYNRFGPDVDTPEELQEGNLTTYKEILLTIWENRPLPPSSESNMDEILLVHNLEP